MVFIVDNFAKSRSILIIWVGITVSDTGTLIDWEMRIMDDGDDDKCKM